MFASISRERLPPASGFVPILLANVIPLVGVYWLGWDAAMVVTIYALEVLLSFPLAAGKALFAQRPPQTDSEGVATVSNELTRRRGSVEVVSWLPPIYPRNVPFVDTVVTGVAWFAVVVGIALGRTVPVGEVLARPAVAASVAALVAGQFVDGWREYFRGGRYERVSPYTVVETPIRQAFFLVLLLIAVPSTAGGVTVLGAFVLGKLVVEWSAFRATHGDGGRLTKWLAAPDGTAEPADPPDVPAAEPDVRISTDDTAVLSTAALDTLFRAPFYVPWFLLTWLGSLAILGGDDPARSVSIGISLAFASLFLLQVAVGFATFTLRYGWLEYRRYGDRLVAYDALVDEPQWSSSVYQLRDVEVVRDRLPDRLLGTRTFSVTTGWGGDETERSLGPVPDPDAFVEAFELPVRTTELEPLDRRVAAVAIGVAGIAVTVLVLAVDPVSVGVFLPFTLFVPWLIWARAYPDGR